MSGDLVAMQSCVWTGREDKIVGKSFLNHVYQLVATAMGLALSHAKFI